MTECDRAGYLVTQTTTHIHNRPLAPSVDNNVEQLFRTLLHVDQCPSEAQPDVDPNSLVNNKCEEHIVILKNNIHKFYDACCNQRFMSIHQ